MTSEPQMPLAWTLTRISPGPIRGFGRSTIRTSSFAWYIAARMVRLLLRLRALHQIERFLRGRPLVHDRADPADHADRIRRLPDVPSHVDAASPLLDRLIREFEGVALRLQFGASRNDEGHRAGFDDLREVVAEVRFDEMRAEFGR